MPSFAAQRLIQQCKDFTADLNSHYLVATFNEKTDAMSELSKNERAAYQNQNRDILEQQVFPAFEQLSNTIAGLQNSGYNDAGLCHFPEGNTYYEYLVHCYTGSDDSVATLEKRTASQRKKICFWYQNCWKITRISPRSQNDSISPHSLPKKCWLRCSRQSLPTSLPSRIAM